MRIVRVKLQNIRSYSNLDLPFPEGAMLLWGDIGAGKTTILLAVEFALFGIIRGELSPEHMLRHGATQGSVELTFAVDGVERTIVRKLKRGKNGIGQEAGYLLVDGVKQEGTAIELKAKILELLGYPDELLTKSKSLIYRYTVFTPQEQMKRILTDQAEYRLDTLRKVFGMDRYKRVGENVEIAIRMLKEREAALTATIALLPEKVQQRNAQQQQLAEVTRELAALQPELIAVVEKRRASEQAVQRAETAVREFLAVQRELATVDAALAEKIANIGRSSAELAQLSALIGRTTQQRDALPRELPPEPAAKVEERLRAHERELQQLLSASAAQQTKRQALQLEVEQVQQRMALRKEKLGQRAALEQQRASAEKLAGERRMHEDQLRAVEQQLQNVRMEQQTHKVHAEQAAQLQERIGKLDNCPTCLQRVTAEHKHDISSAQQRIIAERQEKHTALEQQQSVLLMEQQNIRNTLEQSLAAGTTLSRITAELAAIVQYQQEEQRDGERLAAVQRELGELQELPKPETLQAMVASERELLVKIRELESAAAQRNLLMEQLRQQEQRQRELQELQRTLTAEQAALAQRQGNLRAEQQRLGESEQQFTEAKQQLAQVLQQHEELAVREATRRAQRDALMVAVEQLVRECDAGQKIEHERERLRQLKHWLSESFTNVLMVMEKQVMLRVHQEFSLLFQEWFAVLMEDPLLSARLDDTFNPIIEQNGYETDIESLSGGERTALALAYRLALNKVINTLISTIKTRDLIVLDEPTEGFSDQQLDRVREVLQQMQMRQVIIVSHESKVEGFVDHIIRIGKEGHESKVL